MESSEREDYLEAVLVRHLAAQGTPFCKRCCAKTFHLGEDTVSADLKSLGIPG